MDNRPVVWDASNRRHLVEDHPERRLSVAEIEQVMNDEDRIEIYQADRDATLVLGRTTAGRWLVAAWIEHPTGRYPVHARPAGRRIIRKLIG